jgi:ABC-type multidrug transport system fused ATPase/permease subunit
MQLSNSGVDVTVNSFILPGATILSEIVGLVVVIGTLAIVQPVLALVTFAYLGFIGVVLSLWLARKSRAVGEVMIENSIRTSRLILEIVGALKEVALRSKNREVADVVRESRGRSAHARATMYFLGTVPRFVLEAGLIGGFVILGIAGFLLGGAEQAISAVALFALAGFRAAPSVTRLQTVVSQMASVSQYPLRVLAEIRDAEGSINALRHRPVRELPAVPQKLTFRDVHFSYDDSGDALKGISFEIPMGSKVAFVGASGSGKSTIVDLILGLLEPSTGTVEIDGVPLHEYKDSWRRRVGYVPQEVAVFDATIGQNVALTWGPDYDRRLAKLALEKAQLWELVSEKVGGMDSPVGERGMALSGGQRQRLGIARALFAEPLVLVLDEATSSLDTLTESQVTEAIEGIGVNITRVVVAHRLATIMNSEKIFYLRRGELVGSGTFSELVRLCPEFARQAELAGLA